MPDLDLIAQQIGETYNRDADAASALIGSYYAETVHMAHDPALPSDGPVKGADFRRANKAEQAVFRKVLNDFQAEATTRAEGNKVILDFTYSGVPADGAPVRVSFTCDFTFENGEIVEILSHTPAESMAIVMPLLTAGGLTAG